MPEVNEFAQLEVSEDVLKALEDMGIQTPTTIQKQTIPLMME